MSVKIPENLMNRPMTPGGLSDGTENIARQFGNRVEQAAGAPSAPSGWGGVANQAAGMENIAAGRAVETIARSVQDVAGYYEDLRTAEEDSRAKLMFLEIDKTDAEVRTRLDADPEYAKKSTADQQQVYETERDIAIDSIYQNTGFTQRKVAKSVQDGLAQYKATSSSQYLERVVKPRVVAESKINDGKSDDLVIDKATLEPTAENVASAARNITERYSSPQAFATYGAQGAAQMRGQALGRLQTASLTAFQESLQTSDLAKLPVGGVITTENFKDGAIGQIIGDQIGRFNTLIAQIPMTEQERLILANKGEKYILDFAKKSIVDHNNGVKEQAKAQSEAVQDNIDTWTVQLGVQARNGGLTQKAAFTAFNKLITDPRIKDDPQAVKKAYLAYDKVDGEIVSHQREQRRLSSEAKTRQTIASLRMENGVAVSGGALDGMWKKNGTLEGFFKGGNVVTAAHLQDIDKAGAVPTSVIGSIQSDLRSEDPKTRQRGIQNLTTIKNFSAKAQQALYKELPDGFAGVINRIEQGQTPNEALAFLTRPTQTPDVEKKLRSQADTEVPKKAQEAAMKAAGFDPTKMSGALREQFQDQWRDAFSRAGGDQKLAADLFRQDIAKNRSVGVSQFSNKVEMFPITNFAPRDTVTAIVNEDLPATAGKEIMPVYGGTKTVNGKQVPTYDIYVKEDGTWKRVTENGKQFYLTPESVAARAQAESDKKTEAAVQSSLAIKENQRYWEEKAASTKARTDAEAARRAQLTKAR
jgi:hypothetical protein